GETRLIAPARGATAPHFGPQDDRVYVYTPGGLISLRFDGTDKRTHLKVVGKVVFPSPETADGAPADDVRISPDGAWALASVTNQVYLLAVPGMGGEAPTVNVFSASVPLKKISDVGADYLGWADGGATVTWAVGSTFFRQPVATVVFEEKKKEGEGGKADEKAGKGKAKEPAKKAEKPFYQELAVALAEPRHHPEGTVVLRGAQVITMRGDEVVPDADVVITNNRIAAVGRRGSAAVPVSATVIDVSGSTIVPGFVDTHPHWVEIRRGILDMQNWSFLANLAYGVTAGPDPQTA